MHEKLFLIYILALLCICCSHDKSNMQSETAIDDSLTYYKLSTDRVAYHFRTGNPDSSVLLINTFLHFLNRQQSSEANDQLKAKLLANLATIVGTMGLRDSSIYYYQQAIDIYSSTEDHTILPTLYIYMADGYTLGGDYPNGAASYRRALLTADSLSMGNQFKHAIYNGLGRIYTDLANYPMADYYFKQVEADWENASDFDRYFLSNSRCTYYYNIKEYNNALPWLYKALEITRKLNSPVDQATVECNLGEIYLHLNQPDSAKHFLDKAAAVILSLKNPSSEYYLNGLLASYYLHTDNLTKAEQLLTIPYEPSRIIPVYIYYNDKRLEELYNRKGNPVKAYTYRQRADLYDDSLRNSIVQNNITEIEMRYRQDTTLLKRNIYIANQQKEIESMESFNMLAAAMFIIVTLATTIIILNRRRRKEKRFSQQMEVITTLRMDNLKNRKLPHFIYNVLHSVLPTLRQEPQLSYPLQLLDQLIHDCLLTSGIIAIPLKDEIKIVQHYIQLCCIKQSVQSKVEWEIDPGVNRENLVPCMIIQIPLENALKYAFQQHSENNLIRIRIKEDVHNISLQIEDNGRGFNPSSYSNHQPHGTGNGLKILYKTIELLNENNREKINFNINSSSLGTYVNVIIPSNFKYNP